MSRPPYFPPSLTFSMLGILLMILPFMSKAHDPIVWRGAGLGCFAIAVLTYFVEDRETRCTDCDTLNETDAKFCKGCGKKL